MSTTRTRRYPGLHYFTAEQKDLFFGREAEKRDLLALVLTEKIVAMFSKSGYGKSSLLRAGLAPELPAGWLPVIVQFGAYQAGQSPTPLARALAQLDAALPDDAPEMDFLETICPEDSLWKRFKKKQNAEKRTFLLVFDQFEEFQTYPAEQREAFKKQLAELLFTRIPQTVRDRADELPDAQQDLLARPNEVKALFAIREDRLGVLDGLADKLPAILHKRYHLQGLDDAQATAAITLPAALPQGERFESPAFQYEPTAVEAIKKGLKKDASDPHIESFLLQICCEAIEEKVVGRAGEVTVTEAELPVFKDLFEQYYRGKIAALPDEIRRNAARRMIEDQLVKTDPASGIAYRINADGRALCALPGVDENLLKQLTDFFLLRSEPNTTGGFSYEVSHDRLVEGILVMKKEWEAEEATRQLAAEAERIEREKADAERRRKRAFWTAVAAGVLILVAAGAAVFAFFENRRAMEAIVLADKKTRAANVSDSLAQVKTREAKANEILAKEKTDAADAAERAAEISKRLAELKTKEAKTAADLAEITKLEAEKAQYKAKILLEASRYLAAKKLPETFDVFLFNDSLNFSRWAIETLPAEIGKLHNLKSLDLSGNYLRSLPAKIGNLSNLQSLDLSSNSLDSLPSEIGKLQNLCELNLNLNESLNLHPEIGNLQNLKSLSLNFIHLTNLPEGINRLKKLRFLDLGSNEIDTMPAIIGNFLNLQSLYLYDNDLEILPAEIGNLEKLDLLNLNSNHLRELSPKIGHLKNLKSLDLQGNKLDSLPAEIGNLQSLQEMDLSWNQLSILPTKIGNLQNLISLDLQGNKLDSLPTEIGKLKRLQTLNLAKNELKILPVEIDKLQNLISLNLAGNELKSLPIDVLIQMPNLKKLVLRTKTEDDVLEYSTNPLQPEDIKALRRAMPWCEIVWEE